jgi:hypothetical protein
VNSHIAIVMTSISAPNRAIREIGAESAKRQHRFLVIGDLKSPPEFDCEGVEFHGLAAQRASGLKYAELCPTGHYARKNIGYLLAIQGGADIIAETDDDNIPYPSFWESRSRHADVPTAGENGWINVYRYFTDLDIWPRGFPLDQIRSDVAPFGSLAPRKIDAPIQQGLADGNPDVDAIFRLVFPLPDSKFENRVVALGNGSWCPFNSQNTTWWPDSFPLLYLPAHCSFRMTDIWRSFIAQRIAWENGWSILFHAATVWQERNEHDLMRDFADEVPGYLHNRWIAEALEKLPIRPGVENMPDNLRLSYAKLVEKELVGREELPLLDAWLDDLEAVRG